MTDGETYRGHPCHTLWQNFDPNKAPYPDGIVFYDDGTDIQKEEKPCPECGLLSGGWDQPDPCWGWLEFNVLDACCGHGGRALPYVRFDTRELFTGDEAREVGWSLSGRTPPEPDEPPAAP